MHVIEAEPGPGLPMPTLDEARCTGCGACVTACPVAAIVLLSEPAPGGSAGLWIDPATCTFCGECEAACPELAIECRYEIVLEGATR